MEYPGISHVINFLKSTHHLGDYKSFRNDTFRKLRKGSNICMYIYVFFSQDHCSNINEINFLGYQKEEMVNTVN
jgi:hypothetical protein